MAGTEPGAEEFDRTATLRVGVGFDPPTLDKILEAHSGPNAAYVRPIYDRLVFLTPSLDAEPMLATSWEASEDGTSITFELRDDVVFHDGTPFNADAVVANFERARDHPESRLAPIANEWFSGAETVDEFTVRFDLVGPYAGAIPLTMGGDLGAMGSPSAFDNPDYGQRPVGSGPYRIVESRPGFGVEYVAFEDYYAPERQNFAALEVLYLPDASTRISAVQSGQIHLTHVEDAVDIDRASNADIQVAVSPVLSSYRVAVNESIFEPFADPKVRLAINLALDREEISEALFGGYCFAKQQYFGEGEIGHNAELEGVFDYDPERARELLEEAGYGDGLEFRIGTWASPAFYAPLAELIQAQLAEVGLHAEITLHDSAVFGTNWRAGEFEMILGGKTPAAEPAQGILELVSPDSGDNPGGWDGGPETAELVAAAMVPVDLAERGAIYAQLMDNLYVSGESAPVYRMELCSRSGAWIGTNDVVGIDPANMPVTGTLELDFVGIGA